MRVAVLGAGSWGTTFAALTSARAATTLWARRPALADVIRRTGRNADYLPKDELPQDLVCTASLEEALYGAGVVVMAVPSLGFRGVLADAAAFIPMGTPVVSLAKGLEQKSRRRMSEIVVEMAPGRPAGVLTGPNFAGEILAGHPTASVLAMADPALATELQQLFSTSAFRVYTNSDVLGCEVAGALKNVIAIASGMADGMGFGDSTKAALITRGLAELTRVGEHLGGRPSTFAGLAGMGDLVATCISRHSRNRHVGEELGKGRSMDEVVSGMRMVAEGVNSAPAVVELAAAAGVEVPISEQVVAVLYDGRKPADVLPALMRRGVKAEL
ncbi:MAG TPA: NAD(P)H-dependent glycerol-3-phosphate dehydrogenase [Acidimicrobiales bacterium]|nr:NAD(P)H-dependent glycerol-3-phosphate dehydrogenase [Acidimicrobiales bacterium]